MAKDMYQKRKERQENKMNKEEVVNSKTNINWYPGHMAKTKREIKEILSTIDIVIEVIDSRIPRSSHIEDLNDFINNKHTIIVFNKYDLCDTKKTNLFIKYYNDLGYEVITSNSKDSNDYKKVINSINKYMQDINKKRALKGLLSRKATVLVVGTPNTGKSTLINRLIHKSVAETGNKPGVTKVINKIKVSEYFNIIDSPGVLWPKFTNEETALNLGSMTSIKETVLPTHKIAMHILNKLDENYNDKLKSFFGIEKYDEKNIEEMYGKIGKYKGIKMYKDEPDYDRISDLIINSIKQEKISGVTFDNITKNE